ncbi:hypothetical protein NP233_g11213 [Leucocoprinus birnbaumii]|uniref:Uncharacterized protein n=1 Tax=Leucocoprinus birnbaumii TaxID=56174 RepID=A0AAD5VGZ0_9AGAR|nr:hypothetical protein NP233_g11213 [Leucocoprinus birnbaumii]
MVADVIFSFLFSSPYTYFANIYTGEPRSGDPNPPKPLLLHIENLTKRLALSPSKSHPQKAQQLLAEHQATTQTSVKCSSIAFTSSTSTYSSSVLPTSASAPFNPPLPPAASGLPTGPSSMRGSRSTYAYGTGGGWDRRHDADTGGAGGSGAILGGDKRARRVVDPSRLSSVYH